MTVLGMTPFLIDKVMAVGILLLIFVAPFVDAGKK